MLTFGSLVLWVHIVAIVAWVGGSFAVSLVFVPALWRGAHPSKEVAGLVAMMVHRFQRISREMIFLILLTGILNLIHTGTARGFNFSSAYLIMLVAKVSLFAAMVTIQVWQSFRLVPAFESIAAGVDRAADSALEDVQRLRRRALVTSSLNLVLAASAIFLGLQLRFR